MEENYLDLSKEELIEKLKSKDEQITEMTEKYECLKADATKEIEKAKNMRFETFQNLQNEVKSYKFENEHLKNTIVAMAMYTYPGIHSFDKSVKEINESLKIISKGRI